METTYNRGERLKELRTAKKFTLEQVAGKVGTTKANVSKWENKPNADMNLVVFFKLADLYDVDPRELATGRRNKAPQLTPQRQSLISAYSGLPEELRAPIRALIQTLATASNPSYQAWSHREAVRVRKRDVVHEP